MSAIISYIIDTVYNYFKKDPKKYVILNRIMKSYDKGDDDKGDYVFQVKSKFNCIKFLTVAIETGTVNYRSFINPSFVKTDVHFQNILTELKNLKTDNYYIGVNNNSEYRYFSDDVTIDICTVGGCIVNTPFISESDNEEERFWKDNHAEDNDAPDNAEAVDNTNTEAPDNTETEVVDTTETENLDNTNTEPEVVDNTETENLDKTNTETEALDNEVFDKNGEDVVIVDPYFTN